ncbi:hypothetical protein TanjilG_12424 [Lupinus angustifolius]|uniref:ZCF37 n=1 Tax=Lupinus angustifolius TaxID=3871 RepID=A0A4P1QY90_LUPAN|nr:PREDICTED: uncharacterized protein LOC109326480 [Lupinus angustifolius]OIV97667.1 hypothetical protein TanjilG_12424 [Lupinus angustifolius]
MLNTFVCGNFHHEDEDIVPCSSPKKSKRSKDHSRDNNPYSTRGLDKFSELLADLDQRRQKVYSTMNPQEISIVRFTYSNTDDFVPIVIKKNDKKKHKSQELQQVTKDNNKSETEATVVVEVEKRKQQPKLESDKKNKIKINKNKSLSRKMLKMPSFYVPMVLILILVLLTVFGRSFAILCMSVMWYLVPTLNDSSKPRKSLKRRRNIMLEG